MLHLGLSLHSRRALRVCLAGGVELAFEQLLGTFYLANTSAFHQQAVHLGTSDLDDVLDFGSLRHVRSVSCAGLLSFRVGLA